MELWHAAAEIAWPGPGCIGPSEVRHPSSSGFVLVGKDFKYVRNLEQLAAGIAKLDAQNIQIAKKRLNGIDPPAARQMCERDRDGPEMEIAVRTRQLPYRGDEDDVFARLARHSFHLLLKYTSTHLCPIPLAQNSSLCNTRIYERS